MSARDVLVNLYYIACKLKAKIMTVPTLNSVVRQRLTFLLFVIALICNTF